MKALKVSLGVVAVALAGISSNAHAVGPTVRLNFIGGATQYAKGTITDVVARHSTGANMTLLVTARQGNTRTQCALNLSYLRSSEVVEIARTLQSGAVESFSCVARAGVDADRETTIGADQFMVVMKMD